MIEMERIRELCDHLGISTMARDLSTIAERAAKEEVSYQQFFERMLVSEHQGKWVTLHPALTSDSHEAASRMACALASAGAPSED